MIAQASKICLFFPSFLPFLPSITVERPLTAGDYIQDTAMLKVKIELAHPLSTPSKLAAKEDISTTNEVLENLFFNLFEFNITF